MKKIHTKLKSNWRKQNPKNQKKKGNSQNAHILEEIEKQELQRKQKGNETAERKSNHRTQKNKNKTKAQYTKTDTQKKKTKGKNSK